MGSGVWERWRGGRRRVRDAVLVVAREDPGGWVSGGAACGGWGVIGGACFGGVVFGVVCLGRVNVRGFGV